MKKEALESLAHSANKFRKNFKGKRLIYDNGIRSKALAALHAGASADGPVLIASPQRDEDTAEGEWGLPAAKEASMRRVALSSIRAGAAVLMAGGAVP